MDTQQNTANYQRKRMPHPATADADKFRKSLQDDQNKAQEPVPPANQPAPAQQPPAASAQPSAPAQSQTDPVVQYVPPTQMPVPPMYNIGASQPQQQAPTQPTDWESRYNEEKAKFEQEQANIRKELEDTKLLLEQAQKDAQSFRDIQNERYLDEFLDKDTELSTLDKQDAKRILTPVMRNIREQLTTANKQAEDRINKLETEWKNRTAKEQELRERERLQGLYNTLVQKYPNLEAMTKSEAYKKIMLEPIAPGVNLTVGQVVAAEFNNGNTEYVDSVLARVNAAMNPAQPPVAPTVSPSSVATTPATSSSDNTEMTLDELQNLKFKLQTGEISRTEFRELMKKRRGAA